MKILKMCVSLFFPFIEESMEIQRDSSPTADKWHNQTLNPELMKNSVASLHSTGSLTLITIVVPRWSAYYIWKTP